MIKSPGLYWAGIGTISLNLMLLFGGILWDPGVLPKTYLHYSKLRYQQDGELTSSDEDAAGKGVDEENGDNGNL